MSFPKKMLALAAPAALLTLGGCATGFPAQVSRFQAMPAPQGQTFIVQPADPADQGGLEFAQYASYVREHLARQGYVPAATPEAADLVVTLDYGVDNGRTKVVTTPGFGYGFSRPYYARFGGFYGRRHPFYYGWYDPFFDAPFGYPEVNSYTVYTSFVDMDIKRAADGQSLFEGTAKARSGSDRLQMLVPNLVEALFVGFPGNSGETVRITVPNERRR